MTVSSLVHTLAAGSADERHCLVELAYVIGVPRFGPARDVEERGDDLPGETPHQHLVQQERVLQLKPQVNQFPLQEKVPLHQELIVGQYLKLRPLMEKAPLHIVQKILLYLLGRLQGKYQAQNKEAWVLLLKQEEILMERAPQVNWVLLQGKYQAQKVELLQERVL